MFCMSCGEQLPDNVTFCTKCGNPVTQSRQVAVETPHYGQDQLAPEGVSVEKKPKGNGGAIAVSIVAGIVCLCAVGILVANAMGIINLQEMVGRSSTSTPAATATGSAQSESAGATGSASAESSAGSASASAPAASSQAAAPKPVLIDLSKSDDYYAINIFLSNFTEWEEFWRNGKTFDRNNPDKEQLVNWGMWHNALNNSGTLVSGETQVPGAPKASWLYEVDAKSPDNTYLRHMDTSRIEGSISRYIGLDVSLSGYDSGDGKYYESGGTMYEGTYRGAASPTDYIALADRTETIDDNLVRVEFTVYCGYNVFGSAVSDTSWYGLDGDSLTAAMKANGSSRVETKSGVAVVEYVGAGSDPAYRLVSFSVS